MARSKDEPGKGGFWKLDLERLEESRRSKRRSSLTVRVPKQKTSQENPKPARKVKRYRPSQPTGERKHNILSNISICGETEIENCESYSGKREKTKQTKKTEVENLKNGEQKVCNQNSVHGQNVLIEPINPMIPEDELTGLLLATNGWDECQLEMLDSLLDSL